MSKVLTTFSGPNGDILWAMPTVRAISQMVNEPVDFALMSTYESLIPLIEDQPYVDKAFAGKGWYREHSNFGDQPWLPPKEVWESYERVYHLTYRGHPGLTAKRMPLIDFTADQQGIKLIDPLPFLTVRNQETKYEKQSVVYAFNQQYADLKEKFISKVISLSPDLYFINAAKLSWESAAQEIAYSLCFIGCRSANYVLAHGVGQKNIFTFEPNSSRNALGHLGDVFGCPYARELSAPWLAPPEVCAEFCASSIKTWYEQMTKEEVHA